MKIPKAKVRSRHGLEGDCIFLSHGTSRQGEIQVSVDTIEHVSGINDQGELLISYAVLESFRALDTTDSDFWTSIFQVFGDWCHPVPCASLSVAHIFIQATHMAVHR